MGVSFETCLRRRGNVLMGHRCYVPLRRRCDVPIRHRGAVPLRRLGEFPSRRRWVFHMRRTCDVAWTYRETSLRRCHDVLMAGGTFKIKTGYFLKLLTPETVKLLGRTKSKITKYKNNENIWKSLK